MNKMAAGFTTVIALFVVSCSNCVNNSYQVESHVVPNTGNFETLTYQISNGWTNWSRTNVIDTTKKMVITEENTFSDSGVNTRVILLTDSQYDSLMSCINKLDIENLPSQYQSTNCPEDLPVSQITFCMNGYSKKVLFKEGCQIPEELEQIVLMINSWSYKIIAIW